MLCTLELNGLVDAHERAGAGRLAGEFDVGRPVELRPRETASRSPAAKKLSYLEAWGGRKPRRGWHFLTGSAASIDALTVGRGFHDRVRPRRPTSTATPVIFVATPDGRVSRYLYGVASSRTR